MFVDASAIIAIIIGEPERLAFEARLEQADRIYTSPLAIYEAVMGVARVRRLSIGDAQRALDRFVTDVSAELVPITPEIGRAAINVFERFGRGQHPARLNMGDCFAYACARTLAVPLLFKGDDFSQTDIAVA
jgi:ribonuclease VapC